MRCRDHSTNQQQTLSVALWSESLACGTAWTSTVEERWPAPAEPGQRVACHGIWDGADGGADGGQPALMSCVAREMGEGVWVDKRQLLTHGRGTAMRTRKQAIFFCFLFFQDVEHNGLPRMGWEQAVRKHRAWRQRTQHGRGLARRVPCTVTPQRSPASETKRSAPGYCTKTTANAAARRCWGEGGASRADRAARGCRRRWCWCGRGVEEKRSPARCLSGFSGALWIAVDSI